MNAKQIIGLIGSVLTIVGCFLPIATVPILGGINYAFPPGADFPIGDGALVAGLALLGLLGAMRGGSALLLIASIFGGIIFGNTLMNFASAVTDNPPSVFASSAALSFGPGVPVIAIGLVLMFAASLIQSPAPAPAQEPTRKCPACAELILREAKKCRYCGEEIARIEPNIDAPSDPRAAEHLKAARYELSQGDTNRARLMCQRIKEDFLGTREAEEAELLLAKLDESSP